MKAALIGYGSWGTAISVLLASKGVDVTVTARNRDFLAEVSSSRENKKYLPGVEIPAGVIFEPDGSAALSGADFVIYAVPAQHFRENLIKYKGLMPTDAVIVNTAKGIEQNSLMRLSEIAGEIAPEFRYAVLSGPSHAEEVGRFLPASVVSSSRDAEAAKAVQELFTTDRFRVYTNDDVCGVELGGSLKNIIALGAGVINGMGAGDSAKAALITRGIAEMKRFGAAFGARQETFSGLAGIGDLVVTCMSIHSRNMRCGTLIGQGVAPDEAIKRIGMVVEGVYTCYAAYELSHRIGVEMPITDAIHECLEGRLTPEDGVGVLMGRPLKAEN
ncbi:MAG: NAD(P)H-dependent glycerol-3-phosphate dehydrogenase [Eubacterium sp.]|jgi:glycerol-3-phosphate dehydrogenase (NAD(P)+)